MSKPPLSERSKQELADLARRRGIRGWEGMKKEELIKALVRAARAAKAAKATDDKSAKKPGKPVVKVVSPAKLLKAHTNGTTPHTNGTPKAKPAPAKPTPAAAKTTKPMPKPEPTKAAKPYVPTPRPEPAPIPADKDLSARTAKTNVIKDRIFMTAPDAFWLHAIWELSIQSVQRAEAALGQDWYGAKPILRLFDVTSLDTTSTSESPVRDIAIHGGCNHWYIDVPQPPRSYRADIGYLTRNGRFFPLSRSNVVVPPKAGASEELETGIPGVEPRPATSNQPTVDGQPIRELLDEQFRRPMKDTPFGTGAVLPGKLKKFHFAIDAELIVYGQTDPTASIRLQNEPVKLRSDGSFTMRLSLPDSRQIIPAVATSSDGMEEQTIVLAVERNTKRLDPQIHDLYGETT